MKRICLISCALGAMTLAPAAASAEPAILYIPTEEITLLPSGIEECSGISNTDNSALGCTVFVNEPTPVTPYEGDMTALMGALETGLAAYNVRITNERPVDYIAYTMFLAAEDSPFVSDLSVACSAGGANCASLKRNDIVYLTGASTMNCMMPDLAHSALYAFGRTSGLEGVVNPMDVMNYVPDYTMPVTEFLDECSDRSPQWTFDDKGMMDGLAELECTQLDHVECPEGMNGAVGQNSHADMMLYYDARTEDMDPPEFTNIMPEDGTVLMTNEMGIAALELDVDITDADTAVGVRWTIESEALLEFAPPDGILTICTNGVCDLGWGDESPVKPTDSEWAPEEALNFPAGEYAITLEAADFHGNVADPVSFTVTIEGEPAGASTGGTNPTGTASNGMETGNGSAFDSTGGDDDGSSTTGQDEEPTGCSCTTTPNRGGAALMLLGLMGLGTLRRRR